MSTEQQTELRLPLFESLTDVAVSIPDSVLSQELNGEVVLLDVGNGEYYGLDEVGTRVWQLIEAHGEENAATIVGVMETEYDVDRERLDEDVRAFIVAMEHLHLLTVTGISEN